jgi:autotransporter-associated beta strand protein
LLRALLGSTFLIAASAAQAQDATWLAAPGSNDFNAGANWDTGTAPGSGNTASFGASTTTSVAFTANGSVGGITINANAPTYTFNLGSTLLTFDLAGFVVNGVTPTVNVNGGQLVFANSSSAGSATINNSTSSVGGVVGLTFQDDSSAGNATITTAAGAKTSFINRSTAGNATITNAGTLEITSTAANAAITTQNGGSTNIFGNAASATFTTQSGGSTTLADIGNGGSANFIIENGGQTIVLGDAGNATFVNASTLRFETFGTAGNATITTQNGGSTVFINSRPGGTSRQIIDAGGVVNVSLVPSGTPTLGSIEGAGTVNIGANILTVGSNALSTTFSGILAGTIGRFIKTGAGTLTLTGTSNTYAGDTTVDGGTLAVNGSLTNSSGIIVNNGATLAGNGSVSGVTINTGGTLAPGSNGTGTLTVNGAVTFNAGTSYNVAVSPSASTKTAATGTASLTGATVNAVFQPGTYLTKQYTILSSAGLGGTTFAGFNTTNLPARFDVGLSYTATDVIIDLVAQIRPIPGSSFSGNQQGVAGAVNNFFNNGGALPPGYVTLFGLNGGALGNALSQVSGEGSASGPTTSAYSASNSFINAIIDPSIDGRGGEGGASSFADEAIAYAPSRKLSREAREAYAAVNPRDRILRPDPFAARWSVWASGYGGTSAVSGDAALGTSDTSSRIYGTAVGSDYRIGRDTMLGFALGGAGTNFSSGSLGSGRADLFQLGFYGRHNFGAAYVSGALAYGWQDVTTSRTLTIAGTDLLEGRFKTNTFSARGELGYRYATPFIGLTPYGALQFTNVRLPSYAERATSGSNQFALTFASQTSSSLRSELGLRADKSFVMADGVLTLRGRTAWAHDSNTSRTATPTFQALPGSQSFTVNGARPSADGLLATGGVEFYLRNGWSVSANYEGEFSRTTASNAGKGTLRYALN